MCYTLEGDLSFFGPPVFMGETVRGPVPPCHALGVSAQNAFFWGL